jgi:hypothetical protein
MFVFDMVDEITSSENGEHKPPLLKKKRNFGADLRVIYHVKEHLTKL